MPILDVRLINLYGDPIYVPVDADKRTIGVRLKLQESLRNLDVKISQKYKEVYWHGLFKKNLFKKL